MMINTGGHFGDYLCLLKKYNDRSLVINVHLQGGISTLKYEKRYWYRYSNSGYPHFKNTRTKLLTARLDCNIRKSRNQRKPKPRPLPPVTPAGVKKSKPTKNIPKSGPK